MCCNFTPKSSVHLRELRNEPISRSTCPGRMCSHWHDIINSFKRCHDDVDNGLALAYSRHGISIQNKQWILCLSFGPRCCQERILDSYCFATGAQRFCPLDDTNVVGSIFDEPWVWLAVLRDDDRPESAEVGTRSQNKGRRKHPTWLDTSRLEKILQRLAVIVLAF